MKTIKNIDKKLMNLIGKPLFLDDEGKIEAQVNDLVASSLLQQKQSKDPVRSLKLAFKFKDSAGLLELEDADFDLARASITENTNLTNLIAGQVLEVLDAAEKKEGTK